MKKPLVVAIMAIGLGPVALASPTTVTDGFIVTTRADTGCPPPTVPGAQCELSPVDPDFVKQCCVAPPADSGVAPEEVVVFETSVNTTTSKGAIPLIATLSSVKKEAVVRFVSSDGRIVAKEQFVHTTANPKANYAHDLGALQKRYRDLCGGKRPCALRIRVHLVR